MIIGKKNYYHSKLSVQKSYPKSLVMNMNTMAFKSFMLWLNTWGNIDDASRQQKEGFRDGYKQAISDVFDYCQKKGYKKVK